MNIKTLHRLASKGGGYGFFGSSSRDPKGLLNCLTDKEVESDEMLHYKLANLIDQSFIKAVEGQPLHLVLAYGDSTNGRHDADSAFNTVCKHKGRILGNLTDIDIKVTDVFKNGLRGFLASVSEEDLAEYKKKVVELGFPQDAKASLVETVLPELVSKLNKVSMTVVFEAKSPTELCWRLRSGSDIFVDPAAEVPLSENGLKFIEQTLAELDPELVLSQEEHCCLKLSKAGTPVEDPDSEKYVVILTQAGIKVKDGNIGRQDLLRAHSVLRTASAQGIEDLQQFVVAPSEKKFLDAPANIERVLDFLTQMEEKFGCSISYEDDGHFNIYSLSVDAEEFEAELDKLMESSKAVAEEKHGKVGNKIYWHGEELEDDAPEQYSHYNIFKDDLYWDEDDIGYHYVDQDGGEAGVFYSLRSGDFIRN